MQTQMYQRARVCKLMFSLVIDGEILQGANEVVDDEDKGFSCDPEQGRKANW